MKLFAKMAFSCICALATLLYGAYVFRYGFNTFLAVDTNIHFTIREALVVVLVSSVFRNNATTYAIFSKEDSPGIGEITINEFLVLGTMHALIWAIAYTGGY